MIRAFIAANLAFSVGEEMTKVQSALQQAQGDIHWIKPQGLHLTLQFLGNIEQTRVEPILTALRQTASLQSEFRVRTQGLGAFPSLKRPRVLWAGLSGEGLYELNTKIASALGVLGFPAEGRAFRPHITLGRVRSQRGWDPVLERVKEHRQDDFGESLIDTVTLYQSDLEPSGTVYTALGVARLNPMKEYAYGRGQKS